jgi:alpha-1,3-rhamnosyl/mannosyltransferase
MYVAWIGVIQPRKNLPFLIDVFAKLRSRYPETDAIKLVLIGARGWGYEQLSAKIRSYGLTSDVIVPGYIDDEDLPVILRGARAFLFPSIHEGFGMPVLEAMASGTPVLAAAAGALPEVVGDSGMLLPTNDPEVWSEALARVLRNAEDVKGMKESGIRRARHFTWLRHARIVVEAYRQVIGLAS